MITVPGFRAAGISSGVKKRRAKDLALILADTKVKAAGVFTTNLVKAAPILIGKEKIKSGWVQAVLINSGIANAFTGREGIKNTQKSTKALAKALGISDDLIMPSSTGVIGGPLPVDKMIKAYPKLIRALKPDGFEDAAEGIMTTDAYPKYAMRHMRMGRRNCTIAAIGKGAGMIEPNMATMLAYVMTDLCITKSALKKALKEAANNSFNKIIVDGDTSPNDTVLLLASEQAGNKSVKDTGPEYRKFVKTLTEIMTEIALMIVRDGEGATKAVKIIVKGAKTRLHADKVARTIGNSQLVKTAFYGEDPNWGRIIAAAGRAGVAFDPEIADLSIGDQKVLRRGKDVMDEKKVAKVMKSSDYSITLDLKAGNATSYVVASDLTMDYIKINAHYRT